MYYKFNANIDEVLSINPSNDVFFVRNFNVSPSFPTGIADCDSQSCFFGFISPDSSICLTIVPSSLGNRDHVNVSV